MLRSLHLPEVLEVAGFRRYLAAAAISSIGLWAFVAAISWWALAETGSSVSVGLLIALLSLPGLPSMLIAGVFTDRIGARRLTAASLVAIGACLALLAGLAVAGGLTFEIVVAISLCVGVLDSLRFIAAQVLAGALVSAGQLSSAIAVTPLTMGLGRIVGGGTGGIALELAGIEYGLGFAAVAMVVGALMMASLPRMATPVLQERQTVWREFREGVQWIGRMPAGLALVALGAAAGILGDTYIVLLPRITQDLLSAGSAEFGILTSAGGAGLMISALVTEPAGRRFGRGRVVLAGLTGTGVTLVALALSVWIAVSVVLVALTAALLVAYRTTTNVLLQVIASPPMRGRAIAFYFGVYWGVQPIGALGAGVVADVFGAQIALLLSAGLLFASATVAAAIYPGLSAMDIDPAGSFARPGNRMQPVRETDGS